MKTVDNHPGNHLQYSTAEAYEKSQQQQQQQQQQNEHKTDDLIPCLYSPSCNA